MKIFLDTANREMIKRWVATGLVDGVTTNPTLLSREGPDSKQVLQDICSMVDGPVSIEVIEKEPQAVLEQAREISKFASNVAVKIPFAEQYLSVIHTLVQEDIKINATLIFSPLQALIVAKLGVEFISPFIGRWDDIGVDGLNVLEEIVDINNQYRFSSKILAASLRTLTHWQEAALIGADVATVPPAVLEKAIKHPLTQRGIELFDNDWKKLGKKNLF